MAMIDLHLLKLRYEILNVPLISLAEEIGVPLAILEKEAQTNNWKPWWPDVQDYSGIPLPSATLQDLDPTSEFQEELLSPLEEGAQQYLSDTTIRLRVFNLAKDVYLAHKYASLESAIITKARNVVDEAASASDLATLSSILKGLNLNKSTSLAVGQNADGVPTVIIRDLTGREV